MFGKKVKGAFRYLFGLDDVFVSSGDGNEPNSTNSGRGADDFFCSWKNDSLFDEDIYTGTTDARLSSMNGFNDD